jgi:SAM-dependent methyltransferase
VVAVSLDLPDGTEVDVPRSFTIRESSHRIHNPFASDKLATLGRTLSPRPGTRMLDLACGTGKTLCTWARDYQVTGSEIDISRTFMNVTSCRARRPSRQQIS